MHHLNWNETLTSWIAYLHAANLSAGTIRNYDYRLTDLAARVPSGPAAVTYDLMILLLGNPGWAATTKKNARTAYRSFFGWAVRTKRLREDPTEGLPAIRVPRTLPRPTPEVVLSQTLRAADVREDFMVRLAAYGGLRCCEIANVHADWWDRYRMVLNVRGKGGKMRAVPIREPELLACLNGLTGYAFPNRWTGKPITPGHVTKLLSDALRETWTGHTLRHRYATKGLRGTKNLLAVSRALGHARLDTTQIYTLLDDDELVALAEAVAA
jgi:integrase/recombinase XerC